MLLSAQLKPRRRLSLALHRGFPPPSQPPSNYARLASSPLSSLIGGSYRESTHPPGFPFQSQSAIYYKCLDWLKLI